VCCHEQVVKVIYAGSEVPILVLLKIQVFRDATLHHWTRSSWHWPWKWRPYNPM